MLLHIIQLQWCVRARREKDFDGGKERNLRKSIIRNGALASIFSIFSALAAGQSKFF